MKKMFLVVIAALAGFACNAYAGDVEDRLVEIDGKQIVITDVDSGELSDEKKISPADYPDGIYVLAQNTQLTERLPHASAQIEAQLAAVGFKIVDKMEGASAAFLFFPDGSLNMAGADQGLSQASINTGKVVGGIGAAAGVVSTIGASGAGIGLLVGLLIPQDEVLYLSGSVFKKPVIHENWAGFKSLRSSEKKGHTLNKVVIDYTFAEDKTKQPTQDTVLKMAINEWITRYVNIPAPVTPAAAPTSPAKAAPSPVAAGVTEPAVQAVN